MLRGDTIGLVESETAELFEQEYVHCVPSPRSWQGLHGDLRSQRTLDFRQWLQATGSRKRGLFRPLFFLGFSNASASIWLNVNILSTVQGGDQDEDFEKIKTARQRTILGL